MPAQRAAQPWLGAMLLHVQRSFLLCASFRFTPKLEAPRQLIAHRIFASNLPALVGSRHLVVPAVLVLGRRESAAMCMSDRNGSRQSIVLLVCRTGKAPAPVVMKVEPQSKKPSAAVSPRAKRFARPRLAATLPRRRVRVLTERIYWLALRSSLQLSSPLRLMCPHNAANCRARSSRSPRSNDSTLGADTCCTPHHRPRSSRIARRRCFLHHWQDRAVAAQISSVNSRF